MRPEKNTPYKDLTKEDIKAVEEFKDISDELAQQIADTIRIYTEIIYACYQQERFIEQKTKIFQLTRANTKKAA